MAIAIANNIQANSIQAMANSIQAMTFDNTS